MSDVAGWTFQRRLEETLRRALPKLGPEARAQVEALLDPQALAIVAGVLVAWVVSHAFGIGAVIDVIVLAAGAVAIGMAVFAGIDHLYDFAVGVYRGRTPVELDRAADDLAKAIGLLGIQAVLAVLFRGAKMPRTWRGGRYQLEPPPPRTPGMRYRPTIREDPTLPAGQGGTSFWGDIIVSSKGSATDRALVLLHEKVHQFLTPKLYVLREYRASTRAGSYVRSSLYRYIEEALTETIAQVGVLGMRNFFTGVRFPVKTGYMYLTKGGGSNRRFAGSGAVPEAAALVRQGVVGGIAYELRFVGTACPTEPCR